MPEQAWIQNFIVTFVAMHSVLYILLKRKKMEMDFVTALVGLVSLLLFAFPFVLIHRHRKNKEPRVLQLLQETARAQNCQISSHGFCSDFVIGIDDSRNIVFFYKKKKEESIATFVDLSEIQSCYVAKKTRSAISGKSSFSIIELVELSFVPKNRSKAEVRFELYDQETNMQLSGELQFADRWAEQLNMRIKLQK